jgi:ribonuclease PH
MDAGIPVREHVAGVSVGLVSQVDPTTGNISDYRILTDILVSVLIHSFFKEHSELSSNCICCFHNVKMPMLN